MQQEPFPVASCSFLPEPLHPSHHRAVSTTYLATVSGIRRAVSITWTRTPLSHTLSIAVDDPSSPPVFKLDLKPWHFWRRRGSRRLPPSLLLLWDLRSARFSGGPEPRSGFYVALLADRRLVLLLGDLRSEALRRAAHPPLPSKDPVAVSRREHAFSRRVFAARARFRGAGCHELSVEVADGNGEMAVKVDGAVAIRVERLQWKFRGNQSVWVGGERVEVFWDVHDWLSGSGVRQGLFVFRPAGEEEAPPEEEFRLFLHAWKLD